jgi:hypothetical protein
LIVHRIARLEMTSLSLVSTSTTTTCSDGAIADGLCGLSALTERPTGGVDLALAGSRVVATKPFAHRLHHALNHGVATFGVATGLQIRKALLSSATLARILFVEFALALVHDVVAHVRGAPAADSRAA